MSVCGVVININAFGAIVRLDDGELARADHDDVAAHLLEYENALSSRARRAFIRHGAGRRANVTLAPQISDERLEQQIASYLRSTEESWESGELPAHERHFLRKKKRAAHWKPRQRS